MHDYVGCCLLIKVLVKEIRSVEKCVKFLHRGLQGGIYSNSSILIIVNVLHMLLIPKSNY